MRSVRIAVLAFATLAVDSSGDIGLHIPELRDAVAALAAFEVPAPSTFWEAVVRRRMKYSIGKLNNNCTISGELPILSAVFQKKNNAFL